MNRDERKAFWKFFLTYFVSVALLILAAGYLYFVQMQQQLLKFEHFSLINYAKHLKVGESIEGFQGYTHRYVKRSFEDFSIDNFVYTQGRFEKWVPGNIKDEYIFITKEGQTFQEKLKRLQFTLITVQFSLLSFFALLSFFLARNALAPLRDNIKKLDRFAKDLIHDLNTPVTSIGLNLKVLNKEPAIKGHRALQRLQKSADEISDLHKNLSFLLQEKKYALEEVDIEVLVATLLQDYRRLYPHINFFTEGIEGHVAANPTALKQILDNLLSNACKYSRAEGDVLLTYTKGELSIRDNGIGIKHPERVFERNYTENLQGSGIGMDIVKRLCDMMQIDIKVESDEAGTCVTMRFS